MNTKQLKKQLILNIPYIILGLLATNLGEAWRIAAGANASEKVQSLVLDGVFATAFSNPLPSLYPGDLLVGIACGAALRLAVYLKGKNAKKFRHNEEYGSAKMCIRDRNSIIWLPSSMSWMIMIITIFRRQCRSVIIQAALKM